MKPGRIKFRRRNLRKEALTLGVQSRPSSEKGNTLELDSRGRLGRRIVEGNILHSEVSKRGEVKGGRVGPHKKHLRPGIFI